MDLDITISNIHRLHSAVEEIDILIYTFPIDRPPIRAGQLCTAAWHINCLTGTKLIVRIADTDESGKLTYYQEGFDIGTSLSNIAGFDSVAFQNAQLAIKTSQEGRFVCWRQPKN